MLPGALLAACDAWVAEGFNDDDALVVARRRAIWTLYRYAGVRLVELVWSDGAQLPKLEVDDGECWTLHVLGKGRKTRAVQLPGLCVPILTTYRQLRGLPPQPSPYEHAALIHGLKGGSLHSSGLYDEVKAIFIAAADCIEKTDHAGAARLRSASPHWLRHGYARQLVVDHQGAIAGRTGSARARVGANDRRLRKNRLVAVACLCGPDVQRQLIETVLSAPRGLCLPIGLRF
jgi:site-specific recombinase XerC